MSGSKKKEMKEVVKAPTITLDPKDAAVMTGTQDPAAITERLNQLQSALWQPRNASAVDRQESVRAAMATLQGIAPADDVEGMLAVQMVAAHQGAVECLQRAGLPNIGDAVREMSINNAIKLMALYAKQVEALDRRRGRGQPKMTVEHVSVHAGGQAIVGNVGMQERPALAASSTPALADQEGVAMRQFETEREPVPAERETGGD